MKQSASPKRTKKTSNEDETIEDVRKILEHKDFKAFQKAHGLNIKLKAKKTNKIH